MAFLIQLDCAFCDVRTEPLCTHNVLILIFNVEVRIGYRASCDEVTLGQVLSEYVASPLSVL
jgi:hypothetical protein